MVQREVREEGWDEWQWWMNILASRRLLFALELVMEAYVHPDHCAADRYCAGEREVRGCMMTQMGYQRMSWFWLRSPVSRKRLLHPWL